jgi:putative spermidine/putrescine transport system ATP-binding protein
MGMAFLELRDVRKSFKQHAVVHGVELGVERGELVSFLGPSGCGKTTTLRMVAGFEIPSAGEIRIDGRDVTRLRPNQRNVGMVFQSYALFPNMTAAENVAFGMKVAKRPAAEIASRVQEMLRLIKLPQLGDRYPYQLSGGQQQRVALARALAVEPQVLLLDEPLSALDAKIRIALREEIRSLQQALGITTVYVTHDQEEALSMSDRIVVMNEGRVEQVGPPFEIYNRPRTRFVASFVGTLSILEGTVLDPVAGRLRVAGQGLATTADITHLRAGLTCAVALRPEAARLEGIAAPRAEGRNRLEGMIEEVSFLGSVVRLRLRVGDKAISLDTFNNPDAPPPERGAQVAVTFAREALLVLDGAGAG